VILEAVAFLSLRHWWVLVPLVYGFFARVLTGPTLSPLGQFVTRFVTPRLRVEHRLVPGPPKRFAQAIGLTFSGGALVAWGLGAHAVSFGLVSALVVAAGLESIFAICLGCVVFNRLMRWGVIPQSVCADCNDLSRLFAPASS
jgi:hypothetical protein